MLSYPRVASSASSEGRLSIIFRIASLSIFSSSANRSGPKSQNELLVKKCHNRYPITFGCRIASRGDFVQPH